MTITVTTEAFKPGSGVANATTTAVYSRVQLVGFAVRAGRPWLKSGLGVWAGWGPAPANLAAFVANEALEIAGLVHLLLSYLEQPVGGPVSGTEYLHLLETTEKGQAAARLGNGVTALLAWHVLGVSALHHVANAAGVVGVLVPPPAKGTKRPDFVGRRGPGTLYSTFEAKGTTGGAPTAKKKTDAKVQAQAFTAIAGSPVDFCTACFGRFPAAPGMVEATMIDPPTPDDGEALSADLVGRRELEGYGPVIRAIAAQRPAITLSPQGVLEQPVELFAMGTAGFFGALVPIADALRTVRAADPSDLSAVEAGGALESARAAVSDHRLPSVRPGSPGEARRGGAASGDGEEVRTFREINGDSCELVVLPDGLVLALRRDLVDG